MQRWYLAPLFLVTTLLAGCAAPVLRSHVTVFHEWPASLQNTSFFFARTAEQANDLEYRSYENLVRNELHRLGFTDAATLQSARLTVTMQYGVSMRDIRIVQPVVVDRYWNGAPFYGPRWGGYYSRLYSPFYNPFHSPLWYGAPQIEYQDQRFQLFRRQLKVVIAERAHGKKRYEVTVESEGTTSELATVMPYMIRSAFADFPGPSGVQRTIELRMQQ